MKYAIAIDVGGTSARIAVFHGTKMLASKSFSTRPPHQSAEGVVIRLKQALNQLVEQLQINRAELIGVGAGIPGLIAAQKGLCIFSPNLGWRNVPIRMMLQEALQLPVYVDNDVRVATWGEYLHGAGHGYKHLICITVGTGIGSAIITGGKMLRGYKEAAGELGHNTILPEGPQCNCGNYGCLEAIASARAVRKKAVAQLKSGAISLLHELCSYNYNLVTAKMVAKAAAMGDSLAQKLLQQAGSYLGIGIANYANLINPQLVIIGGGLAEAGEALWQPLRKSFHQRAMPVQKEVTELVKAHNGPQAGLTGAAALVLLAEQGSL